MPESIDPQLWMHYLPITLAAVVPTALFTGLLCWLLWGRRRGEPLDHFAEGPDDLPPKSARQSGDGKPLQALKRKMAAMEQEMAAMDQEHRETVQSVVVKGQRELAGAVEEIQRLRQERDALVHQIESESEASEDSEVDPEIESEVLELREALRESEYQVSRMATEIQLLGTIRTEFEAMQTDNQDLEDELDRFRAERSALEDALNTMRVLQRDLEEELQSSREVAEEHETKLNQLAQSLEETLAEKERLGRETEILRQVHESESVASKESKENGEEDVEAIEVAGAFGTVYETEPDTVDDLTLIEGLSAGLEGKLNAIGIYHYSQIVDWEPSQISAISDRLGFQDRIVRDRWVEQAARLLEANGRSEVAVEPAAVSEEVIDPDPGQKPTADSEEEPAAALDEESEEKPASEGQSVLFFPEFSEPDGPSEEEEKDEPPPRLLDADAAEESDEDRGELVAVAEEMEVSSISDSGGRDDDDDLLDVDSLLGHLYRRPPSQIDDLTRIKGIARVIEGRLHEIGVFRYRQIASWTDDQVTAFSKRLKFRDRIARDHWREQCGELHLEKYGAPLQDQVAEDAQSAL